MRISLRLGASAALVLCLAACEHSEATPKSQPIWVADEDGNLVHNPSGIRVPQQSGRFRLVKRYVGALDDFVAFYDAAPEPGALRVYFSGNPETPIESCDAILDRRTERVSHRAEFTQRLGPWTNIAPLFEGMETGRAAVYDSELHVNGIGQPGRSEINILCGTSGSWVVEYRADYLRDGQGSEWIGELIAATAPQS